MNRLVACPFRFAALAIIAVAGWGCHADSRNQVSYLQRFAAFDRTPIQSKSPDSTLTKTRQSGPIAIVDDTDLAETPEKTSLVSYQENGNETPPIPKPIVEGASAADPILLEYVLSSVASHYPLLIAAAAEQEIAEGKALSASGQFDTQAKASSISQPLGFYKNQRTGATLTQPIFANGGYAYGGYNLGRGDFPTWYKERQTDGGGEYAVGVAVPLLKDRNIDKRRAELFQANLDVNSVEPMVRNQLINYSREAAYAYWYWVAMGQSLEVQQSLLLLAEARVEQISFRVEKGDLAKIASIDNERLIASRTTKLIEAKRKFQAASIKLSLFLRTTDGEPLLPDASQLPQDFPKLLQRDPDDLEADLSQAIAERPEIREIDFELQKINVDVQSAENQLLPKLDAVLEGSKDTGTPASAAEDKTPFEMEAGLLAEVPLQRREARGKLRSAQGKQAQLMAKREFIVNKITTSVQDSYSAIQNARERYQQAKRTKDLALQSLEIGRQQFGAGDIDLIVLNIYEQAETDAELQVIDAEAEYFAALADYHAALGQVR